MDASNIYVIITNFLIYCMRYATAAYFLKRRYKALKTIIIMFAGAAASYVVAASLPKLTFIRFIAGEFIYFIPVFICFSDKLSRKLFVFVLTELSQLTAELLTTTVFYSSQREEIDYILFCFINVGVLAIILSLIVIVTRNMAKKNKTHMKPQDDISFFFLIITESVMFLGWTNYGFTNFQNGIFSFQTIFSMIIVCVMCVISDIFIARTIKESTEAVRMEVENSALNAQIKSQQEYYSMIESEYDQIRCIRHDISNHLYTINALLAEGKHDLAEKYADELRSEDFMTSKHICANPVADAYLLHKIEALKNDGMEVEVSASSLPSAFPVTDVELITILGNLLDNAAEACRNSDNKTIFLSIDASHGYITFKTKNAVPGKYEHKPKIDGLKRGVGKVILEQLAEKYNGNYSGQAIDNTYISSISLPVIKQ